MTPKDHDFDWAKEHLECSVEYEFAKLENLARENRNTVKAHDPTREYGFQSDNGKSFSVSRTRQPYEGEAIEFRLDRIHRRITAFDARSEKVVLETTLMLNDDGECRYRIQNDPKEYLRWQILRMALMRILFPADAPGKRA